MGLLIQVYLTNNLMNWADWLNGFCVLRVMDIHWNYQDLLFWAGIVWHRLSVNQIVRYFKLKKIKNYMRCQVDFLLPLKLQNICYFGLCHKIFLANQVAGFFTFDLFDLLILMPEVHCLLHGILFFILLVNSIVLLHWFFFNSIVLLHPFMYI